MTESTNKRLTDQIHAIAAELSKLAIPTNVLLRQIDSITGFRARRFRVHPVLPAR